MHILRLYTIGLLSIWIAAPSAGQQPAAERVIDVSGPVGRAIDLQVRAYKEGGRPEVLRLSDVLLYPYGIYQPVLTCTVLRACIVELQSGETLISLIAGDDQRWIIDHTATGRGGATPLISVKPTDHDITTNLVLSTDRRVYHITLDSPPRGRPRSAYNPLGRYTRHIKFYFPSDGLQRLVEREELPEAAPLPHLELSALNYAYEWRREKGFPWTPEAVFDDSKRVYIKIPGEAFALEQPLLSIGPVGRERVANYLVRDGFYIVDGLFDHARLVLSAPRRTGLFRKKRQAQRQLHIYPRRR